VLTFVNDKGTNLTPMITTLHSIIDYEALKFFKAYEGTCFRHVMFEDYQYVTNDDKVFIRLGNMSMK
jgi:hypothetical protein